MWNIDEEGCMQGVVTDVKCMISKYESPASTTQPGNYEWTSLIECVSADGNSINKCIVFPRPNNGRDLGMILKFFKVATSL